MRGHLEKLTGLLPVCPPGVSWLPVEAGESDTQVYRRSDSEAYAKLAPTDGDTDLTDERRRITWLRDAGLPCPSVLDWRSSPAGACLITSVVPGISADRLSEQDLWAAWTSLADLLARLYRLPVDDCPYEWGLMRMLARASDVVARGAVNPQFLDPDDRDTPSVELLDRVRADAPRHLVHEARDLVICHGDACLPNFLVDPDTRRSTGMIDLGRLGTADRYADLAVLVANSRPVWSTAERADDAMELLCRRCGIETPDGDRLAFYLRLDPLTWG